MQGKPLYIISGIIAIGIIGVSTYLIIKNKKAKKDNE